MTKAPERIWATMMDPEIARNGTFVDREEYPNKPNGDAVEYVLADLVPQWKPIDTAPRDGTVILAKDEKYMTSGCFMDDSFWEFTILHYSVCQEYDWKPTHWILLSEIMEHKK